MYWQQYWNTYINGINEIKTETEITKKLWRVPECKSTSRLVSSGRGTMEYEERHLEVGLIGGEHGAWHPMIITLSSMIDIEKDSTWFVHFRHDSCDNDTPVFTLLFTGGEDMTSIHIEDGFTVKTGDFSGKRHTAERLIPGGSIPGSPYLRVTIVIKDLGGSSPGEIKLLGIGCEQ